MAKERSRRYPAQTIADMDYTDDIALLANSPAKSLLHSLEWAAGGIGLYVNADKTEYICFNERGDISTKKSGPLKLVDKFTYLGSSVSSTKNDINSQLAKVWTAIDKLLVIWKSELTDKIKCSFFQAAVVSILLYGCTIWTLTKRIEKKLDSNNTRMLQAVLNNSWRQHPTKQQLYGQLPPITKTIKVRWTKYAGHCWRSKDKLISDVLLWTPSHGRVKAGQPSRTYIQQLIQDVAWKTYQEQRTIEMGGERGSGKSVLAVQHDDDDTFICAAFKSNMEWTNAQYFMSVHQQPWYYKLQQVPYAA